MNENDRTLEPEILEAYGGLSTPVSAPADVLDRVEHRIRRRRTARRGVVAVAALAVVGAVGTQVLGGSAGDDGSRQVASDPGDGAATSTLTFTGGDGVEHLFAADELSALCTTGDSGVETLVLTRSDVAAAVEAGEEPSEEVLAKGPLLYVEVHVDDVTPGRVFALPFDSTTGDSGDRVMTFFFAAEEGAARANELSSAEPGASGTVTVHDASCGPTPSLWIEIDGTLGSEVEQPTRAITGEYRS